MPRWEENSIQDPTSMEKKVNYNNIVLYIHAVLYIVLYYPCLYIIAIYNISVLYRDIIS